jgi:hypothetical protein
MTEVTVYLLETEPCYVVQAGLELLVTSSPPSLISQIGIWDYR